MGMNQLLGSSMSKTEFINLLTEMRVALIEKSIQMKEKNIKERFQYFKRDMQKYKSSIVQSLQQQMMDTQVFFKELLQQKQVTEIGFTLSLQAYMKDPECQIAFQKMKIATTELVSKIEVPPELTEQKLVEVIIFILEAWKEMPDTNDSTLNLVLQTAGLDEGYEKYQYNEMQIEAAIVKYEQTNDIALKKAKQEWRNQIQKFTRYGIPQNIFGFHGSFEDQKYPKKESQKHQKA